MDNRIQQAYDHIKKSFQDKLLLADLAKSVNLSPYFFQRLFKQEMNETPTACINRIRLERAAHLIKIDPEQSINNIAIICGFTSHSSFSRAFYKYFKISPVNYSRSTIEYDKFPKAGGKLDVQLIYFSGATVIYNHTSFYKSDMLRAFSAASSFCEVNNIPLTDKRIGILTHISFHGPKDRLNYYAGIKICGSKSSLPQNRTFVIPKGQYACFVTDTSYYQFVELMIQFKLEWLDKNPFLIGDIFAFEEIEPGTTSESYPNIKRTIYIPVKRR